MISGPRQDILILGCSQKKSLHPGLAVDVYDGPIFRTLRKRRREIKVPLEIWIISARHGIIRASERIEPYDRQVPQALDLRLADLVSRQLDQMLPSEIGRVLVLAPRRYLGYIPAEPLSSRCSAFETFSGRSGKSQSRLLSWLGIKQKTNLRRSSGIGPLSTLDVSLGHSEIRDAASTIPPPDAASRRLYQWYAIVDGIQLPAKKLVSALTGAPVSSFETCHALSLLQRCGIETRRVNGK
jgi:hypothetical protein